MRASRAAWCTRQRPAHVSRRVQPAGSGLVFLHPAACVSMGAVVSVLLVSAAEGDARRVRVYDGGWGA